MDTQLLPGFKRLKQFENIAVDLLDEEAKYYFCASAFSSSLSRDNEEAFRKYRIQPRVLRDVSHTDISREILNAKVSCPIGIAPTGFHFFADREAETATALGGAKEECIYIMSSVSSTSMEDVAKSLRAMPSTPAVWMQLYMFKDRSVTLDLLKRAEACNFSAIVVTVDGPISGQWKTDLPDGFVPRIEDKYLNLPCPCHLLHDDSVTFDDLKWLTQQTKLPVVVKGILNGEDAVEAVRSGAHAIYVSNHGGRQIHKVVPTVSFKTLEEFVMWQEITTASSETSKYSHSQIDVLEEVVESVKNCGVDVYLDGGITHGGDIFVALALGAKAVFVGRPIIWGLAVEGEEGVRRVLQILKDELLSTMKLAGVKNIEDIQRSMIKKLS